MKNYTLSVIEYLSNKISNWAWRKRHSINRNDRYKKVNNKKVW